MKVTFDTLRSKMRLLGDTRTWAIAIAFCMISVIEVYSASSRDTFGGKPYWQPGLIHGLYLLGGLVCMWIVSRIPCKLFKLFCPIGLLVSIGLLIHLALGGGVSLNDASRWFEIFGLRFQPSEIAKICLVGTVASVLSTFRDKGTDQATLKASVWVAGLSLVVCLLILKENLSTAVIIGLVVLMMCWYARADMKWLKRITIALIVVGAGAFCFLKYLPTETIDKISDVTGVERFRTGHHRLNNTLVLPEDPNDFRVGDYNTQEIHARIAVSSGGIIGNGPGQSVQRDFLPMAFSDFIYSIVIEEFGILGGTVVLLLYFWLLRRSLKLAKRCHNPFPAYLIMGLSLMLVVQALVNMSVAVGAFPVTGQPLPLISKGGTSTFMTCIYFGMILSVSHTAKQKEVECNVVE